jgi:hypothetical protein
VPAAFSSSRITWRTCGKFIRASAGRGKKANEKTTSNSLPALNRSIIRFILDGTVEPMTLPKASEKWQPSRNPRGHGLRRAATAEDKVAPSPPWVGLALFGFVRFADPLFSTT